MELLYVVSWHIPKGESNVTLPAICAFLLFLLGNFPTYQQPVWVALLLIRTVIIYALIPEFLRFVIRTCNEWTYTYYRLIKHLVYQLQISSKWPFSFPSWRSLDSQTTRSLMDHCQFWSTTQPAKYMKVIWKPIFVQVFRSWTPISNTISLSSHVPWLRMLKKPPPQRNGACSSLCSSPMASHGFCPSWHQRLWNVWRRAFPKFHSPGLIGWFSWARGRHLSRNC